MSGTRLRAWQRAAFEEYRRRQPRDFMAVATPGAGKTTFALKLAADLLKRGVVERIVVVAPTEHLKVQWAQAASGVGIALDPTVGSNGALGQGFRGFAVTYAGLAVNPTAFRVRIEQRRTMVILDEVHHAGDSFTWGDAVREACDPAVRRLCLTGTPFRSDDSPIPFVEYAMADDGTQVSVADHSYGYGQALRDGVVRPVLFMAYSGDLHWRTRAGDEIQARLGEPMTKDATAQALRTALDPEGSWIPEVLAAAHRRLVEVRRDVPDAGGLVIASDQNSARAYARTLADITGVTPVVVLSDEDGSSQKIAEFSAGIEPWMVAVRMVSEGVDIPRLSVGVYATTTSTPLFFAQAVGRFVRTRRRGETATIFLPSVPRLLELASDLEQQRDHVIGRPVEDEDDLFAAEAELLARAQQSEGASAELENQYKALGSQASFDKVLYDGGEFEYEDVAADGEELDLLGIPGLLEPDQVAEVLKQSRRSKAAKKEPTPREEAVLHERRSELRRELNGLVAAWHHRTNEPHAVIHTKLRESTGGPPAASASVEVLQQRVDLIRRWAVRA
ncbi:MAG: DEAD/DEAH box helicase [Aeromicrobium sp.]|uniref:DEAD/DEAH box helicase n=1 Tax=Aeromicrobium sp. TaxID=1871063 RepID=UPI0039E3406D